jgi:hypothetical protein
LTVKRELKGLNSSELIQDQRKPIKMEMLKDLIHALNCIFISNYETLMFKSVLLLAFFLVCDSNKADRSAVNIKDIAMQNNRINLKYT